MTDLEKQIKVLEVKVEQSRNRIAQAEKQYKNALVNLEKQKKAVETARLDIDRVKINIAQRLVQLQSYKETLKRKQDLEISANPASLGGTDAQTYRFNVKLESPVNTSEVLANIAGEK